MKLSDVMVTFKMNAWHRFLFWSVNLPRYWLGMDLVFYPCMIGTPVVDGFKRAVVTMVPDSSE